VEMATVDAFFHILFSSLFGLLSVSTVWIFYKKTHNRQDPIIIPFFIFIFSTSILRFIWFSFSSFLYSGYSNSIGIYRGDERWKDIFFSELLYSLGSISLFSMFVLTICVWADLLRGSNKKSPNPRPLGTFFQAFSFISLIEALNIAMFLLKLENLKELSLFNSFLFLLVSVICIFEISIFARDLKNKLKIVSYGSDISIDGKIKRISFFTTCTSIFFIIRACFEASFTIVVCVLWKKDKTIEETLSETGWMAFNVSKFIFEVVIISTILAIIYLSSDKQQQFRQNQYTKIQDSIQV